jgi:hypothetical protein
VQLAPQEAVLPFETHALLQACVPVAQLAQMPLAQICPAQSPGMEHPCPSAQGRPCAEQMPPQSTPVSFWLRTPSVQESAMHAPAAR